MAAKPKYTQEISKLSAASTRMKEQISGRLVAYWKEDLKGGKTKIMFILMDGQNFQNVLTVDVWSDAAQAHAEANVKPRLQQVVALGNGKITSKGKAIVFHGKQIKMSYDQNTEVKKLQDNVNYGKELPLLTMADISKLASQCAISLVVCVQEISGPHNRRTDDGEKVVSNLKVALQDRQLEAAFWGHKLATQMGQATAGDVYRIDWITLHPLGQDLFKLVSNGGTQVQQVHGTSADDVRGALSANLVSMSPQFSMSRSEKLKLDTSRISLSFVAHMQEADIAEDNSEAYKTTVQVPCCFLKEVRSLGHGTSDLPHYYGCPKCKKATNSDDLCPEHGKVIPNKVQGLTVVLQDPCTIFECTLWKEPLEALLAEFAIRPDVPDKEVMPLLAERSAGCQLVARMNVGIKQNKKGHYVDLFDLAPAVSAEGVLGAFHDLPALPGDRGDGLAPLCCQHVQQDSMGQLQASCHGKTQLIGGAMCMFRVAAEPEQFIVPDIDGLTVKAQATCCVCSSMMKLQQAGVPQTVQKMNRMRVGELAQACVILQNDGGQPFEIMQLRVITDNEVQHEKLHKFQAAEYQKFTRSSLQLDVTKKPSPEVQKMLRETPRKAKRLKVEHTNDAEPI